MNVVPLSDIDQIRDLKARYCRFADAKQWQSVADLFTEDAVMRFHNVDGSLAKEVSVAEFARTVGDRVGGRWTACGGSRAANSPGCASTSSTDI